MNNEHQICSLGINETDIPTPFMTFNVFYAPSEVNQVDLPLKLLIA